MLQDAAEMKKYDNISRAETGRCSGSAFVRNKVIKVSNRAVALGNILPRAGLEGLVSRGANSSSRDGTVASVSHY